jgi:protein involved in polysaccharide export with SLBB domain
MYSFLLLVFVFPLSKSYAQSNALMQQNLSSVKVESLTDAQILEYMQQAKASGLSNAQLESLAINRGMNITEIEKLRTRIAELQKSNLIGVTEGGDAVKSGEERKLVSSEEDVIANLENSKIKSKVFGASLFNNSSLTFEPDLRMPTPKNYQLGPDDELVIDIYGYSQASYKPKVSPEGYINISGVGVIYVNGLTIEQASEKIKGKLAQFYEGMNSTTFVQISLGNIRSIKVTLLGSIVKPGTYTLPSLATIFNALYVSGGPNENGAFRNIELIRNNKTIVRLDIYDFLLRGDQKNNVRLQDQDIIKINNYDVRVEIDGQVKTPGIFELKKGETLQDVINFSGGFTDEAYTALIKVKSFTGKERKVFDIPNAQFAQYIPQKGDFFIVDKILERYENRVTIEGAVFRPGEFALKQGMTVKQLITDADGLKEDAFTQRAVITRVKDNLEVENVSFDLGKLMKGEISDIELKREDRVKIASIFDLREKYFIQINGEVNSPGMFDYIENLNLEDLIFKAGGLRDAASNLKIEVSRRFKDGNPTSPSGQQAEIFLFDINSDLSMNDKTKSFLLKPFDIVYVRASPGYETQRQIIITGEVIYPGTFTIKKKSDRISDAIRRAGGLTALAYREGATLIRNTALSKEELNLRNQRYLDYKAAINDSTNLAALSYSQSYVAIDMKKILQKPGSKYDLLLKEGDIIRVPTELQTIDVSGAVLYPITSRFDKRFSLKNYISSAGGFTDNARKRKTFVIYANGSVKRTKNYVLFKDYPKIKPGAQIVVPKQQVKNKRSTGENIAISSAIATIALTIVSIMSLLK